MLTKTKKLGQVYTPIWVVQSILDEANYRGECILKQYVCEPACGDGAFLLEIINRYISAAQSKNLSTEEIISDLETYIYAVEIDDIAYNNCLININNFVRLKLGVSCVKWNIFCTNTFDFYKNYNNFFRYVFGNPPYIRVHYLDKKTRLFIKKNMKFSSGLIDVYISFFEMGLSMIDNQGVLGFITPNTFLRNTSYKNFRLFLQKNKYLSVLCDFKANKIFDGFSTYTAITIIDKSKKRDEFIYKEKSIIGTSLIKVNQINFDTLNSQKWSFSNPDNSKFLANVFRGTNSCMEDFFNIQYGFATLRDKIFIGKVDVGNLTNIVNFNGMPVEKSLLHKIIKGAQCRNDDKKIEYILFPYHKNKDRYTIIQEEVMKQTFPCAYKYLLTHKEELLKRNITKGTLWYEFGRSQAIQTSHQEKIAITPLVNRSIEFCRVPEDVFVYSGIFISTKTSRHDLKLAEEIIKSDNFLMYIRLTGKDFSGGYKSISTKQIKEFRFNLLE